MSPQATTPIDQHSSKVETSHEPVRPTRPHPRRKGPGILRFVITVLVLGAILGGTYKVLGPERSRKVVEYLKEQVIGAEPTPDPPVDPPKKPTGPWNGLVEVSEPDQKQIGFVLTAVQPQTQPIRLELSGQTDYNLNTLNKVRPRFDNALVEKVFVEAGQTIKKGDPLFVLRSDELGKARNECRTSFVQWDHDKKYYDAREPLARENKITRIMWTDTVNDEKKSRLDYLVSREKLKTYGMTNEQIEKLLEGLGDDHQKALEAAADTQDITRMTVVSPIDGIVVERQLVPENFYDQTDILLTISPMTELWVWGNVFESDQGKVHLHQKCDILFQFSDRHFEGQVKSIAYRVDPETRTLRIRASIPNPDKDMTAGMLARVILQIPPTEGDTIIPRNALTVINNQYYAFVAKGDSEKEATSFERRKLEIEQENNDSVVVKKGLEAGERVVSNGSLILSQRYEDLSTVETGIPVQ